MKKILLFLSFIFAFHLANAQVKEGVGGYATISAVTLVSGTTYNFTITGFNSNVRPRGQDSYTTLDLAVGCVIWSTDCNKFVIASISANTGITMVGTMTSIDAAQSAPTNGTKIAVFKEITTNNFTTYSLPPAADGNGASLFGISIGMRACIDAHYRRQDSIAFANISGGGGSADTSFYKIQTLRRTDATYIKAVDKGFKITNSADTAQILGMDISSMNFPASTTTSGDLVAIYDSTGGVHAKIKIDSLLNKANASLTNTQIGYGSNSNTIISSPNLTYDSTNKILNLKNIPFVQNGNNAALNLIGINQIGGGSGNYIKSVAQPAQLHDSINPTRIPSSRFGWGGSVFAGQYKTDYVHGFSINLTASGALENDSICGFANTFETAYNLNNVSDTLQGSEYHLTVNRPTILNQGKNYTSRFFTVYQPQRANQISNMGLQVDQLYWGDATGVPLLTFDAPKDGSQLQATFSRDARINFNNANATLITAGGYGNIIGVNTNNGITLGNYFETGNISGATYINGGTNGISINTTSNRGAGIKVYNSEDPNYVRFMSIDNSNSNTKHFETKWNNIAITSDNAKAANSVAPISLSTVAPPATFTIDSLGSVGYGSIPISSSRFTASMSNTGGLYGTAKDQGVWISNVNTDNANPIYISGNAVTGSIQPLNSQVNCTNDAISVLNNASGSNSATSGIIIQNQSGGGSSGGISFLKFQDNTQQFLFGTHKNDKKLYLSTQNPHYDINNSSLVVYTADYTTRHMAIGSTTTSASNRLVIDGSSLGNPLKLLGLQEGTTSSDSIVTSASGVLKRLSITQVTNGTSSTVTNPTSGNVIGYTTGTNKLYISSGGTLADLTVTFPTSPTDGQEFRIYAIGQTYPAVIVTNIGFTGGTINSASETPATFTFTAGDCLKYVYHSASATWVRERL